MKAFGRRKGHGQAKGLTVKLRILRFFPDRHVEISDSLIHFLAGFEGIFDFLHG
jgi:hypothetical protein